MKKSVDNQQSTLRELALFAGAGGGILGGHLLGWKTVCAVEWEPYPASVLVARQNDGILPPFPIWDDVQTFDGKPWRGLVDVVSGGFPCQDISSAGRGAGIEGERSGMWKHMARIIGEVRPRYAFIENSPMLTIRGLDRVLCDLAAMGYDAEWGVISAADTGAPHLRERIWILAHSKSFGHWKGREARYVPCKNGRQDGSLRSVISGSNQQSENMADTNSPQRQGDKRTIRGAQERTHTSQPSWWAFEPNVGRVANGVAARVDRLKAIGNGQVPIVAATAFKILAEAR